MTAPSYSPAATANPARPGAFAGARTAFALLPGARTRVLVLTLLGVATSVVDAVAISTVVVLLQAAFGTMTAVNGYGALGLLSNLGCRLAAASTWTVAAVVLGILLLHSALGALYEGLTAHVRLQAYQTFRERVFDRWVAGAAFATGRREPGTMVNTIQNETWEAADGVYQYCSLAIAGTVACGYLVILAATSVLLTAIAAVLGVVAVAIVGLLRRRLAQQSQSSIEQKERLTRHLVSTLHALRTVKAFRAESQVVHKTLSLSSTVRRTFRAIVLLEGVIKPITDLIHAVLLGAVLLAAWQLRFPATIMLGFVAVLYRAQPRFLTVYQTLGRLARTQASVAVVAEHLAPDAAPTAPTRVFPGLREEIRFRDVAFAWPGSDRPILAGLDLAFPKGTLTVVLGRSGAGKSTLVSLLLRFCAPDGGAILCDGEPIADFGSASWLGRIATSGQDVELIDGTVRDNLRLGDPDATDERVQDALELAGAAEIVCGLPGGLDAEVGTRGINLSGGQRQRLCLARALVMDADVLVLDEATNAVDAALELSILRRIHAARSDLTMIVVAHRPAVARIADRVVVLDRGAAALVGEPMQLLDGTAGFAALLGDTGELPAVPGAAQSAPLSPSSARPAPADADRPAVSVVVPVHNAGRTLAATLDAVLAQTFAPFEVLVVDDGSTDDSRAIAARHAAADARVRAIAKPWSGVADTRNLGIESARAPIVAAIDADDLWHPTFLAKMHAALTRAGDDTLFAYANFRRIDMAGRVIGNAPNCDVDGWAFHRFLIKNFVGNGSGMMFRRDAALACGGYDRRLQCLHDAPGCEDWLLQMRLAARGRVAFVPEYLVGYRKVQGAMSEDRVRLNRSRMHAFRILFAEIDGADALAANWALGRSQAECLINELLAGHLLAALRLLPQALGKDPLGTIDACLYGLSETTRRQVRRVLHLRPGALRRFADYEPTADTKRPRGGLIARRLVTMKALDASGTPASRAAGTAAG